MGCRIRSCLILHQLYTRLKLTKLSDQPATICSPERRLLRDMIVSGGFGVFDDGKNTGMLHQSLLWHRGSDTISLPRIEGSCHYTGGARTLHGLGWATTAE
jgi:hypothetical protein